LSKRSSRRDPAQELFDEANRHVRAGRYARARQLAQEGARAFPELAAFWGLTGGLALLARDWDAAESALARAKALAPAEIPVIANLAGAKAGKRDFAAAADLYRIAFARSPGDGQLRAALADSLARAGRPDEALALYAHPFSGDSLDRIGRQDLAFALHEIGETDRGEKLLGDLPAAARDDEVLRLLAVFAGHRGAVDEVLALLRAPAGDAQPSARRRSAALFAAHYDETETDESLFERHRVWGAETAAAIPPLPAKRAKPPGERLRIGFLSPDFVSHSVARFFAAYLAGRDRARVEIVLYADVAAPDPVTARFKASADRWHDVYGQDDGALAAAIAADPPDVLIDLAGHTYANRMGVFARKPAAAQATWLGYPDTTGLPTIDWRLVDAITDPPGRADSLAVEKLVRIEGCFLCFEPPHLAIDPFRKAEDGPVFGSFNALNKIGPSTIALWARVLAQAPGSRLLLKSAELARTDARGRLEAAFVAHGIAPERLILRARIDAVDSHLAAYGLMDVALDPLLYNGTTTSCETLWMGVPVVTLPGTRHAARVGASLLTAAGATEGLATSADDYVARAVELARDRTRDRMAARARFEKSALCDAPGFARRFEAALRSAFT
jgi:protein O-GlcNAc transferase